MGAYLRPGGPPQPPIETPDQLADFFYSRASWVAQTSLYGYLKTRAGTRHPQLFEHPDMLASINQAKWRLVLACLGDIAVYAACRLHRTDPGQARPWVREALARVYDQIGLPEEAGPRFDERRQAVLTRLDNAVLGPIPEDENPFTESPEVLIDCAPVSDEFKQTDANILRSSIRTRWYPVRRELDKKLAFTASLNPDIALRAADLADAPLLEAWNRQPHVIAATTDDPTAETAFAGDSMADELAAQDEHNQYLIAELDGRPIGAMQMIDPHRERSGYWGEIAPNLRALDIWIGEPDCLGKGYGETMMRLAFRLCFASSSVTAIMIDPLTSNVRAHRFYQRLGFKPIGRRKFGEDDCLVHQLKRDTWLARFKQDAAET